MEIDDIKEIVRIMRENDLSLFELEQDEVKIKIKKGLDVSQIQALLNAARPAQQVPVAYTMDAASVPQASHTAPATVAQAPAAEASAKPGPSIDSPMVGTFYRKPSPDSPDFVKEGDTVTEDTTVCIIEAMKVMNEIKAERRGKIKRVVAQDGKPVQYGAPLFELEA